ncbi:AraC family transcriptional regulator [Plantactinospora sp. KBS50]|uniref:helix-turn-helix transcriptional regulator n=1 Tax=Plantactinospora sp. KBS50 TaxID=2024580 RepID=UPI000BAAEA01|nr:AraC family transcriptional regulator [Plantactinospora sp. KBS50]ASW57773.1 hypothetical protein CIK06_16580 [Plantactinospora sp. KBS50]
MIDTTTFRTDAFPANDRFDRWSACMCELMAPMRITSDHAGDFRATAHLLRLGALQVWPTVIPPTRFERTPRLVRRDTSESYHVSVMLDGALHVTQSGHDDVHPARSLYIVDMSRPFDCRPGGGERLRGIGIEIPKALLPLPDREIDKLLARRLSAEDGIAALLVDFLTGLATRSDSYQPADGPRLGGVLIDLLAALAAHTLDAERRLPPETHRHALVLRIQAYIQQHLPDPRLDVAEIAKAHHISVSYLHRLFQDEASTVAAWVRAQRLERARRDLADPALGAVPIHEIAARWGFSHAAVFSRTFRAEVGMAPRDYRHHMRPSPTAARGQLPGGGEPGRRRSRRGSHPAAQRPTPGRESGC